MQLDAENAGIMLIPHAEILQNKTTDSNDDALHDDTSPADQDIADEKPGETMTTTEANKLMSASQNSENQETKTSSLSKQSSENIKKGTEMKLIGTLHKDVGTLKLQQIELVVECMRCKNRSDFKLFDKRYCYVYNILFPVNCQCQNIQCISTATIISKAQMMHNIVLSDFDIP